MCQCFVWVWWMVTWQMRGGREVGGRWEEGGGSFTVAKPFWSKLFAGKLYDSVISGSAGKFLLSPGKIRSTK